MFSIKEKFFLLFVAVAVVVCLGALVSSLNKKMVASCVAGGHSVDYCEFQVYYK